jgi:hypothetical protein
MKIWRIDDDNEPIYFVELKGSDSELTDVKAWALEQYGERVDPYKRNRESRIYGERRPVVPPEILYTTIVFYDVKDVVHFKLTWG